MEEIWKLAVGFGGRYSVSNLGRVRRNPYQTTIKGNVTRLGEKIFKCSPDNNGYPVINIRREGGKSRPHLVHRLVLEAFVGPCPSGMEGAHNDGNPANSSLFNLRWATPKENNNDKIAHGTLSQGEDRNFAKLTEDIVRKIRSDHRKQHEIAKELGVHQSCISYVKSWKTWKHVK